MAEYIRKEGKTGVGDLEKVNRRYFLSLADAIQCEREEIGHAALPHEPGRVWADLGYHLEKDVPGRQPRRIAAGASCARRRNAKRSTRIAHAPHSGSGTCESPIRRLLVRIAGITQHCFAAPSPCCGPLSCGSAQTKETT
jgi:hypothetical protein